MSRKVLGRGLSALLGEDTENIEGNINELDIDLIIPNSNQPRRQFSEENLNELAQSIKVNGVIQPIIVRPKNEKYEIVAGERRWRATQKVGLKKIPAVIKQVSDEKILELALVENIQRQDLNPIEEARAYKQLTENIGLTQETIAERVGKNRTVITTLIRLLKLPEDIQKLIMEEKLSAGHGRALLLSDDSDIQRQVAKTIIEMSLSVRETEKTVKKLKKSSNSESNVVNKQVIKKKDANIISAETKLMRYLGTSVKIEEDKHLTSGKIQIEFYTKDDLNRIFELIINKKGG